MTDHSKKLTNGQFRDQWTRYAPEPHKEILVTKNYKPPSKLRTKRTRRGYIQLA